MKVSKDWVKAILCGLAAAVVAVVVVQAVKLWLVANAVSKAMEPMMPK